MGVLLRVCVTKMFWHLFVTIVVSEGSIIETVF